MDNFLVLLYVHTIIIYIYIHIYTHIYIYIHIEEMRISYEYGDSSHFRSNVGLHGAGIVQIRFFKGASEARGRRKLGPRWGTPQGHEHN